MGNYVGGSGANHGFVRDTNGKITTFDIPGTSTAFWEGTIPLTNNLAGTMTGVYFDSDDVIHSFLRTK